MHSNHPDFTAPGPKVEARIDAILDTLCLEEQIDLIGGYAGYASTHPFDHAGIPSFQMADGPLGVQYKGQKSTSFPAGIALAATWNTDLVHQVGQALGRECRARGVHYLLAPGVNLYRSPLCGRNFEYFGEDPFLASAVVVPWVRGVQDQGVAATVKHYALNYQEYDRHGISSDVDLRTLHEIYLPPYKAAIRAAGCAAVMNAYNLVNGVHCSEHHYLLIEVLRRRWGFDGLVMSDWTSTYDAVRAANGGLDLEMPRGTFMNRENLTAAVESGIVDRSVIAAKVRRLLRVAVCFGWLDRDQKDPSLPMEDADSARTSLEAARQGCVLLENRGILPVAPEKVRRIAVIGPTAHPAVISGHGSAHNRPHREVSILDGLREAGRRHDVEVSFSKGVDPWRREQTLTTSAWETPEGLPGLRMEMFNNRSFEGEPVVTTVVEDMSANWGAAAPDDRVTGHCFSVRATGRIRPTVSGPHLFYVCCNDGRFSIRVAGKVVAETFTGADDAPAVGRIELQAGEAYDVELLWYNTRSGWKTFQVGWEPEAEVYCDREGALDLAREADVVVFCGGHSQATEGEGRDRTFAMDPSIEDLLLDVIEANENTVVVLTAGGNVDMRRWADRAAGVLMAWYPGQEGGTAIAEILFGQANPSGRLPVTFEHRLEDRGSFESYHDNDGDGRVAISDGVFCGYRHHDRPGATPPRYPFGYGLSYTTFKLDKMSLDKPVLAAGQTLTATVSVTNTGERAGAAVVQLYVGDDEASAPRPAKELKGFARCDLEPGQTGNVEIPLSADDLRFYDPLNETWVLEPGSFTVWAGLDAAHCPLEARFRVAEES